MPGIPGIDTCTEHTIFGDHPKDSGRLILSCALSHAQAVPVEDAKRLLVALSGPVRDLTHFLTAHGASDRVPSSYNHLLEEGERISGHDKTLEEVSRRPALALYAAAFDLFLPFLGLWSTHHHRRHCHH